MSEKNFFLIQSVSSEDYSSLRRLALKYPLMNLPSEEALLKKKMKDSEESFLEILPREERSFLFVLKTKEGEVLGSSQLAAKSGTKTIPSYSLRMFKEAGERFLQLEKITDGPSYLGGLILDEKYRGCPEKAGKQLSLIRFLFVALRPDFFESRFHVEVAPFLDKRERSPFFEHFVTRYVSLSMAEIDYLTLTDKEKLFASYPSGKMLFSSLPEIVRQSLGKPGVFSQRAAALLKKQNFQFMEEVDPFDGGPYMQAKTGDIPVIKKAKKVFLKRVKEETFQTEKWLWGKLRKAQFMGGVLEGVLREDQLFISEDHFSAFPITEEEEVFVSPFE